MIRLCRTGLQGLALKITNAFIRSENMSKEHKSIKANKKKAALSPKEKKAAKKAKKAAKKSSMDY